MNTIKSVRKGQPFSREVQGGVYRTPAPSEGLVIDLADKDVFLDADSVIRELQKIGYTCLKGKYAKLAEGPKGKKG